ncbi:unnamed protein product [Phytophthora fragariaefolia]|uniref:Unnamed protein product n=1 Tax=Phytophthora fragariaefolia TaxID=1490495 RepID=A0A9W6XP77_9STRA|nr:unnamed protein product [Phytophthora fragariaefolia]
MEERKLVKESRLNAWFMKMDGLDRDDIGLLDKRVSRCLEDFRRQRSRYYERVEVTGEDPHEEMLVVGGPGSGASALSKVTRACFGPTNCSCGVDATPWESFRLEAGDPNAQSASATSLTESVQADDVGIMDIKRRMGFQKLSMEEEKDNATSLARDAAELTRRRNSRGQSNAAGLLQSAKSIYLKKCSERGSKPRPQINAVLTLKNGAHFLDLSRIGFHSADDLQDLVDIFSTLGLPPVKELDVSNGFFSETAFKLLLELLLLPSLREGIERLSFRGIAVPRRDDFGAIMRLLTGESNGAQPALRNLKTLDLSFNTLRWEDACLLQPLLSSLQRLQTLSLESCFPESLSAMPPPSSSHEERHMAEESVRAALEHASNRLESLNFGSNCIAVESRWLDSLFAAGGTLQKLNLYGMSSSSTIIADQTDIMAVDWQASEPWDLQQLETLTWSSSSYSLSGKLLDALSTELQSGFAQLKHLDLQIIVARQDNGDRINKKIADTICRLADYASLRSCRIAYDSRDGIISHGLSTSVGRLLEDGLRECEVAALCLPQLHLSSSSFCDLLSAAALPKMKKMTMAIGILSLGEAQQSIDFLQMRVMQELTLELHDPIDEQHNTDLAADTAARALARKLETSWLALSSSGGGVIKQDEKRNFDSVSRKLNRSFALSEQHKANRRVYQCRFVASPLL